MKSLLIAVVVVIIVAALGFFLLRAGSDEANNAKNPTPNNQNDSTASGTNNDSQPIANLIIFDGEGFTPANLTVKAGDSITVSNRSTEVIQFASDPHPAHTDNSELNVGSIGGGETQTFTVTRTGRWGYHDHLDDSKTGTIVVE